MKENNVVTSETKDALPFGSLSHTAASSSHLCDRASCRWSTFPQAHRKPFGWKATTVRCPCWSPRLPCSCPPLAAFRALC